MSTAQHQGDADSEADLSLDVVFDILSVERRRRTVEYLLSEPEETTLSDLAEHVAGLENEKPPEALTSQERKRVYVGLYQCHLPRMDAADVVDFDADRKTIELGRNAEMVTPHLEFAREHRAGESGGRNWVPYYLGTSVVGGFVLLVQALLFPIAWLSAVLLDGLILAYITLSLAHAREDGLPWPDVIGR